MENIDRFISPYQDKYLFKAPTGEALQHFGISSNVQPVGEEIRPLYTFMYIDSTQTAFMLDVNGDLEIVYVNGIVQAEPYEKISYSTKETKFGIAVAVTNEDCKFRYDTPIFLSELQALGTVNEENFYKLKEIYGTRLLGAINLKFTRDENGLVSVEACVVNEGLPPLFS